jgi:hypothetical protein
MIRLILVTLISLFSFETFSFDRMRYRHMVSFGAGGFGWSGAAEQLPGDSKSEFSRVDYVFTNLGLNYAYSFTNRIQVGAFYKTFHQEHRFHKKGSRGSSPAEIESNTMGVFALYNFSEDISNAYFLGPSIATYNYLEENSHDLEGAENKAPFELDDSGMIYELVYGKRFALSKWSIEHITFAPQLSIYYRTHGKDFDDQHIMNGVGANIQPIKFDFLF